MGQIRAADFPGLNLIGGRWVFRRRIPRHLKPLAAELLNIKHEITVSLGSDSDEVRSRYAAALADADKKQKYLESEFKLHRARAMSADNPKSDIASDSNPTPAAKWATPVWVFLDTQACYRTIDRWKLREMEQRHSAVINGAVPDMHAEYSLWSEWTAARSDLLLGLQNLGLVRGADPDATVPGFRQKLVELLIEGGHAIDGTHPALRALNPVFRAAWLEVLAAEKQ